ncbi:inter-alpha-trypsin inhibitor heavy chain H3-like isoform X2 [Trematomus bernacchii]|uniref:inter-alpha-trypsin inhibitor heavy chain H3-like isoform X2 n=1 Tax=Trematomus bernacchii TaxID=40690 RepID=UPI00146D1549|nr:inter-alpha-trypsin inhibitor heavy chain H3-like isoform X2 [Trematomus bernacchii]
MERAVLQITLFGLLLALAATQPNKDDWDIYSFHINSTVTSRYATTVITSRMANRMDKSKEIEFHVRIPKNAFISKFRMFIDGQVYDGIVKGKEKARQQYTEAVSRGQSAGLVSSVGRTLEEFKTSVTVAAHKKVTFELTYEELLKRRLGKYELQIHARPMQPVKSFKVDVHIHEESGINIVEVKGGLALADAINKTHADNEVWVNFYPTEDQQKTCTSCGEQGLNGDLVIVYDVNRDSGLGDIKTSAGYFVHHFAPSSLTRISKNVVFLIDRSGSMHGKKMQQTRLALIHILNDLSEDDHFGLITFDGSISYWKRELVQANQRNLESAKIFSRNIRESGATNINSAVLEGASLLNAHPREDSASILILLTDGDPTSGVTNLEQIQSNVRVAIADKFPLYCLGFGFDVNFEFLEKMSLQNNGVARRIYEDSDADLQLKGFYEEVATPLLIDVTMSYNGGTNLTQTEFSQYYNGSEIVVAGKITDNDIGTFTPQVVAISSSKKMTFSNPNGTVESTGTESADQIQRVWAYLTVKQLLEKELLLSGAEKENVKREALELSLKYSFVTPLTSMVVTKPEGGDTEVLHKPKEGEAPRHPNIGSSGSVMHFFVPDALPVPQGLPDDGVSSIQPRGFAPGAGSVMYNSAPQGVPEKMVKQSSSLSQYAETKGRSSHYTGSVMHNFGARQASPGARQGLPDGYGGMDYGRVSSKKRKGFAPGVVFASIAPTQVHATIVPGKDKIPVSHRFLLKAENQSLPLCFDVTGDVRLKLLHHPTSELSVHGELHSVTNGGFRRIVIQLNADLYVDVELNKITVREGSRITHHTGQDPITAGSWTIIRRDKEIDVAGGDTHLVILIQGKDAQSFLWPVLRQQSSDSAEGILGQLSFFVVCALCPALNPVYEEVPQIPFTKLRIKDQEIDVTRANAADYSISPPLTLDCWLLSADSALQRRLEAFIV